MNMQTTQLEAIKQIKAQLNLQSEELLIYNKINSNNVKFKEMAHKYEVWSFLLFPPFSVL